MLALPDRLLLVRGEEDCDRKLPIIGCPGIAGLGVAERGGFAVNGLSYEIVAVATFLCWIRV